MPPELEVEWTDWKGDAFDELTKTDSGVAAAALPVDSSSAQQPPLTSSNPKIEQGSSNLSWSRMTQMPEGNGKVVQQQKQKQQDRTPQKELKLDKLSDMIPSSTATVKVCVENFLLCTCLCAVVKASLTVILFCHL